MISNKRSVFRIGFAMAGLFFAGMVSAATMNFTLYAESGVLTINGDGGTTLDAWGYTAASGTGPVFPAPRLEVTEGDTVNITLVNNHNVAHNLLVKGYTEGDQASVAPGGSHTYSFVASQGGTFLYHDSLNQVNREMGLYGALIVRPAGSQQVWSGGPAYDGETVWVVGDMDKPRWNDMAGSGGNVNTSVYRPNYFLMNGMGGFDAMHDVATTLTGNLGQAILARIVNGGLFSHSLHFHGGHIRIVAVDGQPLANAREATTVNVAPGTSVDVIYDAANVGLYPMHIHTAQMETANGVYLNGVAAMISIQ